MMKVFGICTAFIAVTFSLTMLCVENCLANGDSKLIANASFEHGVDGKPSGWELSGNGKWMRRGRTGKRCVSVVGNGTDSGRWSCIVSELKPMALYRLTFWVKCDAGTSGGCVVAGVRGERKYKAEVVVAGINRDFGYSTQWRKCSYVFITPPDTKNLTIYIGQWHVRGRIYIDDVSLTPVQAIHAQRNGVVLGHDEEISDGNYIFTSRWRSEGSNYSRTLKHFTAGFNTNRWVMDEGASVTYLHNCGYRHKSAKVMVTLWWYQRGELVVEVSRDGKRWIEVARFKGEGEHEARLPEKIFPCTAFVRLRSEGLMQVTRYVYEAELGEPMRFMSLMPTVTPTVLPPPTVPKTPPTMSGSTTFITVEHRAPKDISVRIASIGNPRTGNLAPKVRLENRSDRQRKFTIIVTASGERVKGVTARRDVAVDARGDTTVEVPCPLRQWGRYDIAIAVREGRKRIFVASTSVNVAALHMSDYGELLTDGDALSVWWCESTYKVSRERPLPKRRGSEIRISAAANEYEPFQVVLRPKRELRNVRVSATELRFKRYTIPASAISVRTVEYVHVTRPTDAFGCVGWHPDPLPNHDMPITLRANLNQPFWLTVRVPKGTPKGTYRGSVTITADGIEPLRIPIALRVYGFELTDETHTRTAYGVGVNWRFHGIKTWEQARQVYDLYMRDFREHRISPYVPYAYAPVKWKFIGPSIVADTGAIELRCNEWSGHLFDVRRGGENVGAITCCLTQFERKGIGWKGTGVGWVSPQFIKRINWLVRGPLRCVVEITGERTASRDAQRRFETTYRFEAFAGMKWFVVKCMRIKNTDKVRWRLDGFYYLLPPASVEGIASHNAGTFGAWLWRGRNLAFGAVALDGGLSFRLRKVDGAHGDVYRGVGKWLEPGEEYDASGDPMVAIFVTDMNGDEWQSFARTVRTLARMAHAVKVTQERGEFNAFGAMFRRRFVVTAKLPMGINADAIPLVINLPANVDAKGVRVATQSGEPLPMQIDRVNNSIELTTIAPASATIIVYADATRMPHRAPTPKVALRYEERKEVELEIDFTEFDRAMRRYMDDFKFNAFNARNLVRAIPNNIGPHERFTDEFEHLYRKVCRAIEGHLRERGWLDKAYFYWFDEPSEEDYPFVVKGMKLLKRVAPGVKRLLTEQPEPPLYGHVDIWVPVLSRYDFKRAREMQKRGDEVWWYVCCGPRAPYPNNFIDHPAICHRIRFWMMEKYGVQGSLYWSTTYWAARGKPRNPWEDPASYSPTGGFWGNGDGFLLYPPRRDVPTEPVIEGPVDSIRWELLREGLEDREYFWTLRQVLKRAEVILRRATGERRYRLERAIARARKALKLPSKLAKSLTEWNRDPKAIYRARNEVAMAIEALNEAI